jgi:hypothetical protein
MPEEFFATLKKKIAPEWKKAFLAAVIIGFFTHLYVFVNYIPNHDGLINIYNTQLKFKSGRFFLGPFSGISSYFDLPLINGLLSITYLGIFTAVLVELLKIRKTTSIWLMAGLIVTFPTIPSTFSYMFTADGYMFGFLLAGIAVLLTQKFRYGFAAGALVLYVSVGIYQANLPLALTLVALVLIQSLLEKESSIKPVLKKFYSYMAMVVIGMVLYAVTFKTYQNFFAGEIADYQGLNEIGHSSPGILPSFQATYHSLASFFFNGLFNGQSWTLFEFLNILLLIAAALSFLLICRRHSRLHVLLAFAVILAMPVLAYCMYFVSPGVSYHMLMVMSLVSLYLLPILFYEQMSASKVLAWSVVLALGLTVFNFSLIANISYFNTTLKYEKSLAYASRVLDRVEQTEGYENANKIAVFGTHYLKSEIGQEIIPSRIPEMTGVLGETMLLQPHHYQYMFANQFGVSLGLADESEREQIENSRWYQTMPVWPHPDSIHTFKDIVVIKLSE